MSLPHFPPDMTKIEWEQALSMVVASIAAEELALSHILNAEGEKLQYVLGTLHQDRACHATTGEILKVNESIGSILDKVETNQLLLKGKLEQAIKAKERPCKKTCVYHAGPGCCWCRGEALAWLPEAEACCGASCAPQVRIPLPAGGSVLVSYTFALLPGATERHAAFLLQRVRGSQRETLAVEERRACCPETTVHLSGCVVVPPGACGESGLECVLSVPCCVCVKEAALTVTAL